MQTSSISPTKPYCVVIGGGMDAAVAAIAKHVGPRSMRDSFVNGYGAVMCTIDAEYNQLQAWFESCHDLIQPGVLSWFHLRRATRSPDGVGSKPPAVISLP